MRKIVFLLFIIAVSSIASAQTRKITFRADTIHLRGYVYYADGKPAMGEYIFSRQFAYHNWSKQGYTIKLDSTGYFEFKGTAFNDTLNISNTNIGDLNFYNKGSRYMLIYLPLTKPTDLQSDWLAITAKRVAPKPKPLKFNYIIDESNLGGGYVESVATFPGGIERLYAYIYKKLQYPQAAIAKNIEGTVKVRFTVMRDGAVTNIKLLQGIGYGCDEAVISMLRSSPKWKPASTGARAHATDFTIVIPFKLED